MKLGDLVLGRYVVERALGRGGMGTVVVARHDTLGHRVAVKQLDIADSQEAESRFLREAQAMAAIKSAHVVQVIDFGKHEGRPVIVMEMLAGDSLADRLDKTGVLTWPYALRLGAQVARGLADIHARGLLHRDIKPANLMICSGTPEVTKIVDFGIAKPLAPHAPKLTMAGIVVGTPAYMAPEQLLNLELSPRADIYALGTVLWECIAGGLPFGADYHAAVARVARDAPPVLAPTGLPAPTAAVQQLLCRMLAPDPTARPADCHQVANALERLAAGQTTPAPAATSPAPAPASGPTLVVARLPAAALATASERQWLTGLLDASARSYTLGDLWIAVEPPRPDADAMTRERTLAEKLQTRFGPTVRCRAATAPADFRLQPSALVGVGRLPPLLASLVQAV
ncbi:MAG: serine/threonine-protein kinase [Myxococcota bacterium]